MYTSNRSIGNNSQNIIAPSKGNTLVMSGNRVMETGLNSTNSGSGQTFMNNSTATLKGKVYYLEESISNSKSELMAHANETEYLKTEKESIEEMMKSKQEEVKNSVLQDLNKIIEELQRHFGHQKSENKRLKQQVDHIKSKNQILQKDLEALDKRVVDLELQVGIDDVDHK